MNDKTKSTASTRITMDLYTIKAAVEDIFKILDNLTGAMKKKPATTKKAEPKKEQTGCFYMEKRSTPFKARQGSFEITFGSTKNPKAPHLKEKFDNLKDFYARIPGLGKYVNGGSPETHVQKLINYFKRVNAPVEVIDFRRIKKGGKK